MSNETYKTIAGETITYVRPTPEAAAFLARVVDATNDPRVSAAELTNLIYGKDNPILDQTVLPTSGVVTRAVFENPLYRVMTDLLGRKRAQEHLVVRTPSGESRITVAEAAEHLWLTTDAVRKAIADGRLSAERHGGIWMLKPDDVAAYRPVRGRGPQRARLDVSCGAAAGASFRVKVRGGELVRTGHSKGAIIGYVERFERIAVIVGGKGDYRYFELEPGGTGDGFEHGEFYVRGRFSVRARINNAKKAIEAWKAFRGDAPAHEAR